MAAVFHRRRRRVQVAIHDAVANRWVAFDEASAVDRDHLTLATFNVWFDDYFAERRYRAIADLLCREMPDVMVFQEMTPKALDVLLAQPWIQEHYRRAGVVGASVGNYGMLMLTRLPTANVTYTRLPTRLSRGPSTGAHWSSAPFTSTAGSDRLGCVPGSCAWCSAHSGRSTTRRSWVTSTCVITRTRGSPRPIATCGRCCGRMTRVSPRTRPSTSCVSTARPNTGRCVSTACFSRVRDGRQRASNFLAHNLFQVVIAGSFHPITSA
jgi:hypothetical protein